MWTIIKFEKNKMNFLKKELKKKLDDSLIIYTPKLLLQKYKNKKLINQEFNLLGDYLLCFHKSFEDSKNLEPLRFSKGLKYFLNGFIQSQSEIKNFVQKCKNAENDKGYISLNFFEININSIYKFTSGPFSEMIFKIISLQKHKINILLGNLKTTVNKDEFLFNPV